MGTKHDIKEIHLKVDSIEPYVNKVYTGFIIRWSSDIGFGEYRIYRNLDDKKWYGDSEFMDDNDDKEFISELMRLFIEQLHINE